VDPDGLGRDGLNGKRRLALEHHDVRLVHAVQLLKGLVLHHGEEEGVAVVGRAGWIRPVA